MAVGLVAVNYVAVLVAAIVGYVIGMAWYSPSLFGKMWMNLANIKPDKKGMTNKMIAGFVGTLVMSFVLAHFIVFTGVSAIMDVAMLGFLLWLGFLATTMLGMVLWEGKPVKLYILNTVHYLVVLIVMGAILVSM